MQILQQLTIIHPIAGSGLSLESRSPADSRVSPVSAAKSPK
jgi:hypothetical protein